MSHFYNTEGALVTEVPNKSKGGMRPCTVKDAKALGLVPGPTSVLSQCSSKEWLVDWKLGLVDDYLQSTGWKNPGKPLKQLANELSSTGRDFGTTIHKWMERLAKGDRLMGVNESIISKIYSEFQEQYVSQIVEIETGFYDPIVKIGGTRDLLIRGKDDKLVVVDYKSTSDLNKKMPDDYVHQLHFYSHRVADRMMILWIETQDSYHLTGNWKVTEIEWSEEAWEYCRLARRMYGIKVGL